jgi:hypothetical protein
LVLAAYGLGLLAPKIELKTIASKNIQQLTVKTMIISLCGAPYCFEPWAGPPLPLGKMASPDRVAGIA